MDSVTLGLDIGSNSVGSAWIDTKRQLVRMGVSVFPAGVEQSDQKRGAPKNQARRDYRGQRRSIRRRARRKHELRTFLQEKGWMPSEHEAEREWLNMNPWLLRSEGLRREMTPDEFGRILLHMAQRRGAYGLDWDVEDEEHGKTKEAIGNTWEEMKKCNAQTFGELIAIKFGERRKTVGSKGKMIHGPIRNRTNASQEGVYEFCADRDLIRDEFDKLWRKQQTFAGELAKQLTEECRKELDNRDGDATWRCKGILFCQRRTYWDKGTISRCDLEPTDLRCPKADMYAQEFLVLETVNNIRITPLGELKRRLTPEERKAVIDILEKQKTASVGTVRKALGIDKGLKKTQYTLSLESDPERDLNTNWFRREIINKTIGRDVWQEMSLEKRESVNKAILKFNPQVKADAQRLGDGCRKWWGLDENQARGFIEAWKTRGRIDDRIRYSRKAIKNLLSYMREGYMVSKARQLFAEDADNGASDEQRKRYAFGVRAGSRAVRRYTDKHPDLLPPAPAKLSNPVVRKAIHEVRRHIQAYLREFGRKPDRVVVELAREARQSAVVRNKQLAKNRQREKERKEIIREYKLEELTRTQQERAVKRILLCKEQRERCVYCDDSNDTISDRLAAAGEGVELDHIIPQSRGGDSGLNNLVLSHTKCNRSKGNKTPREWLTAEQFGRLEQRLEHLKAKNKVKWENLHKEVPDLDGFVESQLTDAAYAARQVTGWLRDVLYGGESDGRQRVFTTKGRYTAMLRRDWGLFPDKEGGDEERGQKNRADHRHHALDAVLIALSGPERLSQLAQAAKKQELAKSKGFEYCKREPLSPPWGDFDFFRVDVMKKWKKLVVAHRPEKRKITGSLHNDTQYGPIVDKDGNLTGEFTIRKFAVELTPNHLRVPERWEELRAKLETAKSKTQRTKIRVEMLGLEDVKPGKSGVVRDRWFREELRGYLRDRGLNVDAQGEREKKRFAKQMKELVQNEGMLLRSRVPVRRVTLLRRPTVIEIKRKCWNPKTRKIDYDPNVRSRRYYEPQDNHHIEIRENEKGKWTGEVITNFDAARRVRPPKTSGQESKTAVNREDTTKGRFVMSLSIGETVDMWHPRTGEADYFVVFKIDGSGNIHFTPHYDAGRAKETETCRAREDVKGGLSVAQLQKLGVEPKKHPEKVWVGPLGDVEVLERD